VLWEAVTGQQAFPEFERAATLNMTLTERGRGASLRRPDQPPELEADPDASAEARCCERYAHGRGDARSLERLAQRARALADASLTQLMSGLFWREMREQRQQIRRSCTRSRIVAESGSCYRAAFRPGLFESRGTQVSSVTDLMQS